MQCMQPMVKTINLYMNSILNNYNKTFFCHVTILNFTKLEINIRANAPKSFIIDPVSSVSIWTLNYKAKII